MYFCFVKRKRRRFTACKLEFLLLIKTIILYDSAINTKYYLFITPK